MNLGVFPRSVDKKLLRRDIDLMQRKYYDVPLSQISLGKAFNEGVAFKPGVQNLSDMHQRSISFSRSATARSSASPACPFIQRYQNIARLRLSRYFKNEPRLIFKSPEVLFILSTPT